MKKLHNKYFILRHGESKANVAEIIISNMEDGIKEEYSLTEKGEDQVINSVTNAKNEKLLHDQVIIYSSPFSRCKKTAQIAKEVMGVKNEIKIDDRLKERWFGNLDKTNIQNYQKIWSADKESSPPVENEETAEGVEKRATSLIFDIEKQYTNKTFLLVSHGDVLQILEAWFLGVSADQHTDIKPIQKAEIRELK